MTWRQWTWCVPAALVVVGVAAIAGCPSPEPEQSVVSEPPMQPEPIPPEEPGAAEPAEQPAVEVAKFEYTEAPTVEDIPAGPLTGMLHGEPFSARTIRIEKKDEDTFQMQISNGQLTIPDSVTSTINDDDGWRFRFTVPEGSLAAMQWAVDDEKTFDDEHVYYYYDQGDDKPTMSVNGPWGAALEITDWTVEEPSEGSHVIGTIEGRVALVMRETDRSWVAGEFEAPVYER